MNTAVILAAGIGSRLFPITEEMPKSLIRVCGREIVDYQIQGYLKSGIKEEDITIVIGYKAEQFKTYLSTHYPRIKVIENKDYLATNNMFSLYLALKHIKETYQDYDYLFINNADCIYDESVMNDFINCQFENAIASSVGEYIDESMKIEVDKQNHRINNIAKTISQNDSYAVTIDLYKYSKQAGDTLYDILYDFIEVKKDLKQWTEVAFPHLFKKVDVFPFDINHRKWIEIDNMDDLLTADKRFSTFNYASKKAYICDLDGTLFTGDVPIEPATQFVRDHCHQFDFYYLTNNTSRTPDLYVKKLKSAGINAPIENIVTPLYPLIEYLKKYQSVYLVANTPVADFIKNALPHIDFNFDRDKNEAVVLTYDTEMNYEKMVNVSFLLNNQNVEYIATHTDIVCPTQNGNIPDIGSFITLFEQSTGKTPDVTFGKPSINLIRGVIDAYGAENIAIVGDRLYTDLQLAINSNIDFVTVLSGETTRLDAAKNRQCKFIYKNLGEIV